MKGNKGKKKNQNEDKNQKSAILIVHAKPGSKKRGNMHN